MSHRDKKLLYHLTALENLASVMEHGLLSRAEVLARGLGFEDVADPEIIEGRGDLDRRVPFHFMPRSPFDYAVVRSRPRATFVLLAVSRKTAIRAGWEIVPRHPLSGSPEVYPWADGFDRIDWHQMDREDRDYNDHECKMVCMAEALSPTTVTWGMLQSIWVPDEEVKAEVRKIHTASRPYVTVNRGMFPG